MNYAIINISTGICENVADWDGVSEWQPPHGTVAQESDVILIGNECELIDGVWSKKENE